jgi:hypothetical protein
MVCMGDGVEDRFLVAHDKANGWWELCGSMRQWIIVMTFLVRECYGSPKKQEF